MHAFFLAEDGLFLEKEEAQHAYRVLRLRAGDEIEVIGKDGRYLAVIDEIDASAARVRLQNPLPGRESPLKVTVYQGVPKAEKMELISQKLTELGVDTIVPVQMERCVVKLNEKDAEKRAQRLERIAKEAVKQCGRWKQPEILPAMSFAKAVEHMKNQQLLLVPWEEARGVNMQKIAASLDEKIDRVGIVIGPEGGISEKEVEKMIAVGARAVTLGPRILRTETASIVSAALAMALWGDI